MSPVTALIADDEEHLRAALRRRLAAVWPALEIVAEARNGLEALEQAAQYEPTVAFLDIRMPGLDGLEVARHLARRCHLVFVTAYDEYAVAAFERAAVDYLLKPVTEERLAVTVGRLRERLERELEPDRLGGLLAQPPGAIPAARLLRWIRAAQRDMLRLIAVEEVHCFIAADKYTSVFTAEGEFLIRKPIKELEAELDPQQFWRIHRSTLVNIAHVECGLRDEEGRLRLRVRGLERELPVSRACAHLFRQM